MFSYMFGELPLGLDPVVIALHIGNLAILVVVLTILVYKPVKKFMDKRASDIRSQYDQNAKDKAEAENMKKEYEEKLLTADQTAEKIIADKRAEAIRNSDIVIAEAEQQAEEIIASAKAKAEQERAESIEQLKGEVGGMAVEIASAILEREIKKEDDDKLIEDCLKTWEKDHE